ncbi:MAG: AAA family ATPase, partial [Thermoanaerobaculia bacterium]
VEEVIELVGLGEVARKRVGGFSLGMGQRLGVAAALLGDPQTLILDEPANGLDPAGIREMRQLLRRLSRERGLAVFVSSHLLAEVELMCDRVAILHRGKILAVDRVEALLARSSRVRFRTSIPTAAQRALRRHASQEPVLSGEDHVEAEMPDEEIPRALTTLSAEGIPVFEVLRERPPLEELFLELTHGETV